MSPERPSRRVATRRKVVVNESDYGREDAMDGVESMAADEDFTPAPKRSPRKTTATRRKTSGDGDITPKAKPRTRKPRPTESSIEPSQVFEPESTLKSPPASPSKRVSPRKPRKSTVVSKKGWLSDASSVAPLPTPEPSVEPEPASVAPLSDITERTVNGQAPPVPASQTDFVKVKPLDTILERPMDIVVRTRAQGVPQTQEPQTPKARTVIKYLVLNNFKSYAGRQEVGPFHASFSSVVGPNGSGKSNVIDSLLFVFGFRASKMRQGKLSALIHNSAAHPSLDYCEVEVHFEEVMDLPGGKHETVQDSTLIISRKAYRNNSSDYFMNGTKSNFTAVTTLLREKGVDLDHKRFLILQGEVESIAQMKPKAQSEHEDGLLEYLEDIIGTSKYKTHIDKAAVDTETLNEVCVEKSARVQHVEKEKKGLEDKKNKALAYVRDENELALKQNALYQVYKQECTDNLQVTEEAAAHVQKQLEAELGKHKGNEDVLKEMEKACKKSRKDYETLEKDAQAVLKELAKCEKEKVKFDEKKKFLAGKRKKLEKALQTSRLSASEAATLTEKHQNDVQRSNREITDLEQRRKHEEKELAEIRESLKGKTQVFSDAIAEKQKSLEPWNEKISQKQSAIAVAQSELDMLCERASAGENAINEVHARIAKIKDQRQNKITELEAAASHKATLEKSAKELQQELAKVMQKEPEVKGQLSGARQKADEARASLSSSQSKGHVLNGLTRLKESGRIEGFHGRLGNLGTIDQNYDVAISTACPQLDNLVADSVEVGQQCIDYLRKNNLGRANIVCLDKLARRDMSLLDTPENVPRLFDLVKPKHDMFRSAFFNCLQNTLVAKDLTQANRIAYGARRWRVVTLDGQLIDVSGTMSGGGTRIARGAMSSKLVSDTTKDHVLRLEADLEVLEQQYREVQDRQRQLEIQAKEASSSIPLIDTEMQKLDLEISSLDRTLADAENRIRELAAEQPSSSADKTQIASLQKGISKMGKELETLHSQTIGVDEEIKELQNKIMEVGGIKLRMQKAKVDSLKEQIDTLTDEASNAEVAKSKAEKDKVKHYKMYDHAEKDLEATMHELEQLETDGRSQYEEAATAKERAEEAQTACDNKKDELETLKQELEEKTAELNQTRAVEIEMRNKLEENQKALAENQKRLRYWTDKLEKLELQPLSDLDNNDSIRPTELPSYTKDELLDMSKETLKAEIAVLEERTTNASVDLGVLDEYRRRAEEHASRFSDLQSAIAARDAAKRRCDDLRRLRLEGFMQGFSTISLRLKEMYQMITMGGNAELELVDSLDPFSEGILFSVMPPKKSWKNISNLSGGEKTLSSLALVFALHHYRPTPLYVMDEIDAALDFRNVSIVASYIKERTKNAQFIVISLRNNMFELAARLVGVYKVNHMTKSVTVENKDYIIRRRA